MRPTKGYMLVPSTWRCQKFSTPCVHKFGYIIFKFYLHVQDTIPKVCWLPNYKDLGVHFEISLKKRSEICLVPRIFRLVHACSPLLAWMTRKKYSLNQKNYLNSSFRCVCPSGAILKKKWGNGRLRIEFTSFLLSAVFVLAKYDFLKNFTEFKKLFWNKTFQLWRFLCMNDLSVEFWGGHFYAYIIFRKS